MGRTAHVHASDVRGFARLVVDATTGVTDLVEQVHRNVASGGGMFDRPLPGSMSGIAGLTYASVRGVTRLIGGGLDAVIAPLVAALGEPQSSRQREAFVAALNGVLGDHLAATGNPLAIPMRVRRDGKPVELSAAGLAAAFPQAGDGLIVMLHGLCMSDLQWKRNGHDHGAALSRDLGHSVVYLHYNSGLHISVNGRALSGTLEALLEHWPCEVRELSIVGHSMGGLTARSAVHYAREARRRWPARLRRLIFVGTPHHGSPLERGGHRLQMLVGVAPFSAPFAGLGRIRSAGITDLRHGNLLEEDWAGTDRFAQASDRRRPVPLPVGVDCYAIAATTGRDARDVRGRILGDGLVPVDSALGRHHDPARTLAFEPSRQWVGCAMSHFELLNRPEVYAKIRDWLAS